MLNIKNEGFAGKSSCLSHPKHSGGQMTFDTALHFSLRFFWTVAAASLSWLGSRCRDGGVFCAGKGGRENAPHVD
jgi:hypothetical protein